MHFIYSCTLLSGTQGPHLGGWDSLLCLHSLCQARWLLSLRGEEERWKEKGKEGSSESPLTAPEWSVPRATTSGDHLLLAYPASSAFVPFPLAHAHFLTLFFQVGEVGEVVAVAVVCLFSDLCPYFSNFSASLLWAEREEEQEGVSEGGMGGGGGGGSGGGGGVKA